MAWFLGAFGSQGGKNLGIYNCRTVRGGSTTSLHGEGRACDFGINPHGAPYGTLLADRLRMVSGELGIQCIIWNRRIWSGSYPDAGWRAYSGTNPHLDHIHLELSKASGRSLTSVQVHRVLSPVVGALSVPPKQPSSPAPPVKDADMLDNIPVRGSGTFRRILPVGRASAVLARAWVSLVADGPGGATAHVYFQSDGGGIADRPLEAVYRDGWSSRAWAEAPDGTTQINVRYDAPDGAVIALEGQPR